MTQLNMPSWFGERSLVFWLACTIDIAITLVVVRLLTTQAMSLLQSDTLNIQVVMVAWIGAALHYLILFAGMRLGGLVSGIVGTILMDIFFALTTILPYRGLLGGLMLAVEVAIRASFLLEMVVMCWILHYAGKRDWFAGRNVISYILPIVLSFVGFQVVNGLRFYSWGGNFFMPGFFFTGDNFVLTIIVGSVGGVWGFCVGSRLSEWIKFGYPSN